MDKPETKESTYDTVRLQKPYKAYVLEEQVSGRQAKDFNDWVKEMKGG